MNSGVAADNIKQLHLPPASARRP